VISSEYDILIDKGYIRPQIIEHGSNMLSTFNINHSKNHKSEAAILYDATPFTQSFNFKIFLILKTFD